MENKIIEEVLCNRCGNEMEESIIPINDLIFDFKQLIPLAGNKTHIYLCPQCNGLSIIFRD